MLMPVTLIVAPYAPLAFLAGFAVALIGALLWGIGLGAHESVTQAAVAQMIPQERLGLWPVWRHFRRCMVCGQRCVGTLYDVSVGAAVLLAVAAQLLAAGPLIIVARSLKVK